MAKRSSKSRPTWTDVKTELAGFDRLGLIGLIHDLYGAQADVQIFLHARFGLGQDVLKPFKQTIDRWLWPDLLRGQDTSVAKAKQAISNYKKAIGEPEGLAELMVFFCERAVGFCREYGDAGANYYDSLARMFGQALASLGALPANHQDALLARLDEVRLISHDFGYGVGDDMDFLMEACTNPEP